MREREKLASGSSSLGFVFREYCTDPDSRILLLRTVSENDTKRAEKEGKERTILFSVRQEVPGESLFIVGWWESNSTACWVEVKSSAVEG